MPELSPNRATLALPQCNAGPDSDCQPGPDPNHDHDARPTATLTLDLTTTRTQSSWLEANLSKEELCFSVTLEVGREPLGASRTIYLLAGSVAEKEQWAT